MNNPDQPPDHPRAAAQALTELGHHPGADPVQQLCQVAANLLADRDRALGELATLPADSPERAPRTLALSDLFGNVATALIPLTEAQLDALEQQAFANAFGLDQPGGTT